jgi:hypothetical protein
MKKALILVIAALALPSVALAAKTTPPTSHGPKVAYILAGTLSNYTAYDAGTSTNGSITIHVRHANYHGRALRNMDLTFAVDANTRVVLSDGVTAITNGDRGAVRLRAALRIPRADLATTLQQSPARRIKDNGAPTP